MTHFETARVNEMLGLQIGVIKDLAQQLNGDDLEQLEKDLILMGNSIKEARSMVEGLPHRHKA